MKDRKKKKISKKSISMFLFTVPATVLYCIFFIYPIAIGIMYSFTDWNGLAKDFKFVDWQIILRRFPTAVFKMP